MAFICGQRRASTTHEPYTLIAESNVSINRLVLAMICSMVEMALLGVSPKTAERGRCLRALAASRHAGALVAGFCKAAEH
jgi:hypothetical protein